MLPSCPVPSGSPGTLDSTKQPCPDIGKVQAAYDQANGPPSPQLVNHGWCSPYFPSIRPLARLLPWTLLNNHVLEYWHGLSRICPRVCAMAQTVWLLHKSSHPPTLDYCCLDGYVPPTIWQPEGIAAYQGERQAEVYCKVQTVWYLTMLPWGMSSVKDINSMNVGLVPLNGGAKSKRGFPWCTKQCLQRI